jgi:hypothetical protein
MSIRSNLYCTYKRENGTIKDKDKDRGVRKEWKKE